MEDGNILFRGASLISLVFIENSMNEFCSEKFA